MRSCPFNHAELNKANSSIAIVTASEKQARSSGLANRLFSFSGSLFLSAIPLVAIPLPAIALSAIVLPAITLTGCSNDLNDPMVVRHKAMLAEQRGDLQQALKVRGDFIKASPDYYYINEVHFEQGMTHLSRNEYKQALEHFNSAIRDDPRYTQAFIRRCQTHTALGNYEEAIRDAERAMELSETDRNLAIAFLNLGDSQNALENYEEAIASWRMSLMLDPAQVLSLGRLFESTWNLEIGNLP